MAKLKKQRNNFINRDRVTGDIDDLAFYDIDMLRMEKIAADRWWIGIELKGGEPKHITFIFEKDRLLVGTMSRENIMKALKNA